MVARHGGLREVRRNRFAFGPARGRGPDPRPAPAAQLSLL
jgi:hypothetical protein